MTEAPIFLPMEKPPTSCFFFGSISIILVSHKSLAIKKSVLIMQLLVRVIITIYLLLSE